MALTAFQGSRQIESSRLDRTCISFPNHIRVKSLATLLVNTFAAVLHWYLVYRKGGKAVLRAMGIAKHMTGSGAIKSQLSAICTHFHYITNF